MADSIIIKQEVNGIRISTVNLKNDDIFSFETACFFGTKMLMNEGFQCQYTTVADAIRGHQKMVERVLKLTA